MNAESVIIHLRKILTIACNNGKLDCTKTLVALPDFFLDIFVSPGRFEQMVGDFKKTLSGKGRNIPAGIEFKTGGNAWNTCYAAACLGVKSSFIGPLGSMGEFYTSKAIKDAGSIDLEISRSEINTDEDNVSVCFEFSNSDSGAVQNVMISHDPTIKLFSGDKLSADDAKHLSNADIIAFSNWGANQDSNKLLKKVISSNSRCIIFFDPANLFHRVDDFPELIDLLDLIGTRLFLSMNQNEWDFLNLSTGKRIAEILKKAKLIIHDHDKVQLISNNKSLSIPTFDIEIKFQTGLGDAFSGGFISGYSAGLSDEACLLLGSAYAGFLGNTGLLPNLSELSEFINTHKLR